MYWNKRKLYELKAEVSDFLERGEIQICDITSEFSCLYQLGKSAAVIKSQVSEVLPRDFPSSIFINQRACMTGAKQQCVGAGQSKHALSGWLLLPYQSVWLGKGYRVWGGTNYGTVAPFDRNQTSVSGTNSSRSHRVLCVCLLSPVERTRCFHLIVSNMFLHWFERDKGEAQALEPHRLGPGSPICWLYDLGHGI